MSEITRRRIIEVSYGAVWELLADFESISTWADFVDHASLMTEQTEGVGMTRRIQMGRTTVTETVTAWEPGVTFSYVIGGLPPVIESVTNTWRLGASGDSTVVLLSTDVRTGARPPQRAIGKAVARRLAKSSEAMLSGLDAYLTSDTAP
jgi:hypothetical protein